jgi:GTP-binding protein
MAEEAVSPDAESQEDGAARALEHGRWLFAQDCRFLLGAVKAGDVPDLGHPEVAFAGRSNVGKSSLVNALTGRKTLARTSNTPGRTQQLNFFDLGERLVLVDLPGYGYARASKSKVKDWTGLTRAYLRGRAALRRVCLLIDARHGFKESDRQVMTVLDGAAVSYQVIFTKSDKTTADALARQIAASQSELARRPAAHPQILATSALAGRGVPELRAALAALAQAD